MHRALKRFVIAKTHSLTRDVRIYMIDIRIIIDMEPVVKKEEKTAICRRGCRKNVFLLARE